MTFRSDTLMIIMLFVTGSYRFVIFATELKTDLLNHSCLRLIFFARAELAEPYYSKLYPLYTCSVRSVHRFYRA